MAGVTLCIAGCLAASLVSSHYILVANAPPPNKYPQLRILVKSRTCGSESSDFDLAGVMTVGYPLPFCEQLYSLLGNRHDVSNYHLGSWED